MKILSASFFWRNDEPDGLGITLRPPAFTPEELTEMFGGEVVRDYIRESDAALGTDLVATYLAQLSALARDARRGPLSLSQAMLAALNIMWLAERGFIPNDEYNGPQFIRLM